MVFLGIFISFSFLYFGGHFEFVFYLTVYKNKVYTSVKQGFSLVAQKI